MATSRSWIVFSLLCLVGGSTLVGRSAPAPAPRDPAVPVADFAAGFCAFPRAWASGTGTGATVIVVRTAPSPTWDFRARVADLAPGAAVRVETVESWLSGRLTAEKRVVVLLAEAPASAAYGQALEAIAGLVKRDAVVVLPAYFGPMRASGGGQDWQQFVRRAAQHGAIVAGAHGRAYQAGTLGYWKAVPVDVFAVHRAVDGDSYGYGDSLIDRDLSEPAAYVAAAVALLRGREPGLDPAGVRAAVRQRSRRVYWLAARWSFDPSRVRVRPMLSPDGWMANAELRQMKPEVVETMEGRCLDAALLLGLPEPASGGWALQVLNVAEAQKRATGRGVTVAILDHLFDDRDPALAGRMVAPGCIVDGEPVFSVAGHGVWMARELLKVAPGVRIMPVRFMAGPAYRTNDLTDYYIKGLDYAVQHQADIVSLSHQPIPQARQADLDRAIERAASAGVTLVYIHYQGDRTDIVDTNMIEFAPFDRGRASVYVVGTGFTDPESFPYTWGVSQTAPLVAGVAALLKELDPTLTPSAIRTILLESGRPLASGFKVLDAGMALGRVGGREERVRDAGGHARGRLDGPRSLRGGQLALVW